MRCVENIYVHMPPYFRIFNAVPMTCIHGLAQDHVATLTHDVYPLQEGDVEEPSLYTQQAQIQPRKRQRKRKNRTLESSYESKVTPSVQGDYQSTCGDGSTTRPQPAPTDIRPGGQRSVVAPRDDSSAPIPTCIPTTSCDKINQWELFL